MDHIVPVLKEVWKITTKSTRHLLLIISFAALMILIVLNFAAIIQGLGKFVSFFKPFFIGLIIAFILNKPCIFIERQLRKKLLKSSGHKLTRGLAITGTYILMLLLLIMVITFIVPPLIESVRLFIVNIGSYLDNTQDGLNKVAQLLQVEKIDMVELKERVAEPLSKLTENIPGLLSQIISVTTSLIGFFATLFIALIFSIYLLAGKEQLLAQCKNIGHAYLADRTYKRAAEVYHITVETFNKYVFGQLTEACILGGLCFIGMLIFGFEYALMISTLIAVTALIPYIGAFIGGFVGFIIILMITPMKALLFIVFLIVLQQFEGNIIYPRVVGSSLGLPGIWVLLAVVVGGGIAGPLGILLGVPIATILYILLNNDVVQRMQHLSNDGVDIPNK